jgi:PIN domain nuclease of toxin-antitoxin system
MNLYVADTHALFWYLTASPRLGAGAKRAFDEGTAGAATILIPSIALAELYFVNLKMGKPLDFAEVYEAFASAEQFEFVPFVSVDTLDSDADESVPEMHDRMIVGVTRRTGAVCMTRDTQIVPSQLVKTIW